MTMLGLIKVVGFGIVGLRTHDGVMMILTNVRLVPQTTRNIKPLWTLELKGCHVMGDGGEMEEC